MSRALTLCASVIVACAACEPWTPAAGVTPSPAHAGAPVSPSPSPSPSPAGPVGAVGAPPTGTRGCLAQCTGVATVQLGRAVRSRIAEVDRCNETRVGGASRVKVRIAQSGAACTVDLLESNMSAKVNDCALGVFAHATYPQPIGGCIEATVQVTFTP